jgi:hypothetical protein
MKQSSATNKNGPALGGKRRDHSPQRISAVRRWIACSACPKPARSGEWWANPFGVGCSTFVIREDLFGRLPKRTAWSPRGDCSRKAETKTPSQAGACLNVGAALMPRPFATANLSSGGSGHQGPSHIPRKTKTLSTLLQSAGRFELNGTKLFRIVEESERQNEKL